MENGIRAVWCVNVARGIGRLWCADVARGMGSYNECESINTVQWLAFMLSIREVRVRILNRNAASLRFFILILLSPPNQILTECIRQLPISSVSFSMFIVHYTRC
jgi:hypothetical protein